MNQQQLSGKVVVVTGGAGLIGRQFCEAIASNGGTVIIADKNEKEASKIATELNQKYNNGALGQSLDITSDSSIQVLIENVHNEFGYIDALVNNAYPKTKNYGLPFEEVTYNDFVEIVGLHTGGYFLTSKHFLNYFRNRKQGNIVNMSSIYGVIPPRFEIYDGTSMTMPVEYAVIKAGIIHMTKYFARYYKGLNIRCNCISPGGIFNHQPEEFIQKYNSFATNKGMLEAKDLNGTLIFLLSDESQMMNGQNLVVDDGFTL